jgi:tetratricopeptide (TPR) repeat protein
MHPEEKTAAAAILASAEVRADPGEREFVAFSNTAVHPPLPYLPQAAGIFLARRFSPSVLAAFYAGRLLNFLAAVAVTFLAVRLTPVGKWAFAALALTPMTLSLAASLSPDALTNALSFLLVAQVLALAFGPEGRAPARGVTAVALLGAAVGWTKQTYFPLPLSYLLIPARKLGGRGRYWAGLGLVLFVTALAVAGWAWVVRGIYSPPDLRFNVNPPEQLRLLCADPAEFLSVLLRTARRAPETGRGYLGWLGWLDTRMPDWVYLAEAALLVAVCVAEYGPGSGVTVRQALVAAGVAALAALVLLVIVRLTFHPVGAPYLSVQGRYFIPLGPLAGIAVGRLLGGLVPVALRGALRAVPAVAAVAVPVLLGAALFRVHDRYYVDSDLARAERCYLEGAALRKNRGREERARELYEEALRYNPGHSLSHFFLAQTLEKTKPREAAEHYRFVIRWPPSDETNGKLVSVVARNNLANLLTQAAEYPEAIRLYRESLQLEPEKADVKANLNHALRSQEALETSLRRVAQALVTRARADLLEARHQGTPREGLYFKPNRGKVTAVPGGAPLPAEFLWRCPPPCGEEIQLAGSGAITAGGSRAPFYACSAAPLVGAKRVFVFPGGVALLADEEVSWYYQRRLAELSAAEREREAAYRRERGLRFPLAAPPD